MNRSITNLAFLLITTLLCFINGSCEKNRKPIVESTGVVSVTTNSAVCIGRVISDNGQTILSRGICWSLNPNPTISDNYVQDKYSTAGGFEVQITGLFQSCIHYFRAYATNSSGTSYGSNWEFLTRYGTVTDIDANLYYTQIIGEKEWMTENLKVTKYNNGGIIPNVTDNSIWAALLTGAYCDYENNSLNLKVYGHLYNFYAISDFRKICPLEWHVPNQVEWLTMESYLGGVRAAGDKMKEGGFIHWPGDNSVSDNSSGFTALPGGFRGLSDDYFYEFGLSGWWWTSTSNSSSTAWGTAIFSGPGINDNTAHLDYNKKNGFSIRCVKD